MRFAGFLHSDPFLEYQHFVNLAVFIRTRSSLILSCSSGSFPLYYVTYWSGDGGRGEEENYGEGRTGGERKKSVDLQ